MPAATALERAERGAHADHELARLTSPSVGLWI
jgi:hypothetical protein